MDVGCEDRAGFARPATGLADGGAGGVGRRASAPLDTAPGGRNQRRLPLACSGEAPALHCSAIRGPRPSFPPARQSLSEQRSILRTTGLLGLLTLLSRFTGLARDSILAALFGGSRISDVFLIAFEAPNLARRVIGEGALSAFVVPLFTERRKRDPEEGWRFCNRSLNAVTIMTVVLMLLGMIFARELFGLFGGFGIPSGVPVEDLAGRAEAAEAVELGVRLTRIMLPYQPLLAVAAIMMGVCHAIGSFGAPGFGSIVLNLCMIGAGAAALWLNLDPSEATVWLAWSVVAGAVWRVFVHVPAMRRAGWRYRPRDGMREEGVGELFRMMGTGLFGLSINQINLSVSSIFAGFLGAGNKTYLVYSNRLIQFPMALTATALATAMLPRLSALAVERKDAELRDVMGFSKRLETVLMMPAVLGLMVFGEPIVRMVFERGRFTAEDSFGTFHALLFYAPGLIPTGWSRLVVPLYYARKDVATPVKAAVWSMIANVALSAAFTFGTDLEQRGIALAATLSSFINYGVLWWGLRRDDARPLAGSRATETLVKCAIASVASIGAARALHVAATGFAGPALARLPGGAEGTLSLALSSLPFMALAAFAYFPLAHLLRVPDSDRALEMLTRKLRRRR